MKIILILPWQALTLASLMKSVSIDCTKYSRSQRLPQSEGRTAVADNPMAKHALLWAEKQSI